MAKMFYTIEEVCEKLAKSEDDVKEMVTSGQIQEFRDRDRLMFKVEQIDLLAGGDEESGDVHLDLDDSAGASGIDLKEDSFIGLADSRESSTISLSDSRESSSAGSSAGLSDASSMSDSRDGTGISVFDTDHGGEEESEQTHVGDAVGSDDLNLEEVGSGSGLLDLTRESDDTSLGAELLEEVYSSDENVEIPASASGLFEAASDEGALEEVSMAAATGGGAAVASVPMVVEAYDGAGSGLGAGMLIGAVAALVCVAIVAIVGVSGATPGLAMTFAGNIWVWFGGLIGVTLILGVVGFFIGKASG